MIFEAGFVHADPHPGNLFARKTASGDVQLVILDHGLYTELEENTRIAYAKLWRGILSQDELQIKHASCELGADFFQLFTAMIVNRTYDDVMDKKRTLKMKARLGDVNDSGSQAALQNYALYYHKDIVEILDTIKRELLLVMKTNNYLRAIDRRLGNPNNTFSVINETSWQVYKKEIWKRGSYWLYFKEAIRYWFVRTGLFFMYCSLRIRMALGFHYDPEALEDFDLDVTHHNARNAEEL
jgi:aarF domain-containing kinase